MSRSIRAHAEEFSLVSAGIFNAKLSRIDKRHLKLLWQTEAQDIGADRERYKLVATDHVGHGRGFVYSAGRKMP